jgi:DNA-binding MarR family transcriptional regulator
MHLAYYLQYAVCIFVGRDDACVSIDARRRNLVGAFALALSDRIRGEVEAASGLNFEAAAALATVAQQPGGTVESLRQAIGRSHSATVRIVERLVEADLVERRAATRGPALALTVTAAGRTRAREMLAARALAIDTVLAGLDPASAAAVDAIDALVQDGLTRLADLPEGVTVCRLCDKGICRARDGCAVVRRLESQGLELPPGEPL